MNATGPSPVVLVKLRESTVALLMAQRLGDETLDAVTARLARVTSPDRQVRAAVSAPPGAIREGSGTRRSPQAGKYGLRLLGETLRAGTLAGAFGALIDRLTELDPGVVEKLAPRRSRKRAYVAKERAAIHPGRPDLPVRRTRSGWWISANIGSADLDRALRAVCAASGLTYGRDVCFLGKL